MSKTLAVMLVAGALAQVASAQFLMMPDSTNSRLVLFSPDDGSLVNPNYFAINVGTTPIHAMQVGREIWVSEQVGDRLSRWGLAGGVLGAVSGGMDNIRGMALIGGTVYVTNDGTANGAPGAAVVKFDTTGAPLGFFATPWATSPFGILEYPGGMLLSSSDPNDDIHKYVVDGTSMGTFINTTSLAFLEQMDYAANGDVLVSAFTTGVVARLDPTTGALISTFPAPGARGVWQLSNGNILWTNGSGAHVYNVSTGGSTQVYAGGGRYLDLLTLEPPCPADFNGDNQVDFFDYLDFVAAFDAEDPAADFNGDNQVDFFDYLDFAAAFDVGCE
jgi:hypothetical protein